MHHECTNGKKNINSLSKGTSLSGDGKLYLLVMKKLYFYWKCSAPFLFLNSHYVKRFKNYPLIYFFHRRHHITRTGLFLCRKTSKTLKKLKSMGYSKYHAGSGVNCQQHKTKIFLSKHWMTAQLFSGELAITFTCQWTCRCIFLCI